MFYHLNVLFQAIKRLSSNDPKIIQTSCGIMNRVCTNGKDLQEMLEKLKTFDKEKRLNQAPTKEGKIEKSDMQ